jgi:GNAT superfamily N-acetyltransferase
MVNKCELCEKTFEFPYLLKRHKDNKTPCNIKKIDYKCDICKSDFKHKSDLERHEKTKKHITNITNGDNYKIEIYDNNSHELVYIKINNDNYIYLDFRENDVKIIIILIDKKFRNEGFGSKLLNYSIKYIKSKNNLKKYNNIIGDLMSDTEYIEYFYKKHGFSIINTTGEIFMKI